MHVIMGRFPTIAWGGGAYGFKNPCVPLDMGRYGAYAPHTVEYQIYRGEATDSAAARVNSGIFPDWGPNDDYRSE